MALQDELSSTANRIAFSRQYFNDVVTKFNTKIETFPGVLVAKLGLFPRREQFAAEEDSKVVPSVSF